MPNQEHYTGSNSAFPQGHHGFTSNPQTASTPAAPSHPSQHQHAVVNHRQPHPGSMYPHYTQPVQAPYQRSDNFGYASQPLQMPTAPADRSYMHLHHSEVPVTPAGGQPQFSQNRYPDTYPQYGYPTENMQPAYATAYPPVYSQPGSALSAANRQQSYTNGTYPPSETHSAHPSYPPQMHNSGQISREADRPGMYSIHAAESQSPSQLFAVGGNTNPQTETSQKALPRTVAYQQPRDARQQCSSAADSTSSQLKNSTDSSIVKRRQPKQNNPHIVKPAVINLEAAGKYSCFCCH